MNVIRKIKYYCKTDEDLKRYAESRIRKLTRYARQDNHGKVIGANVDINPQGVIYKDMNDVAYYGEKPVWYGFVPKGTKIVYGRLNHPETNIPSNAGYYYYNDDVSYIFDFYKYIKEMALAETNDVMSLVNDFIDIKFLKFLNASNRKYFHRLVSDKNYRFFKPSKEHVYSDFYGNGSARCSEIALMVQNLFSSLDLDVAFMIDNSHAYNVLMHPKDPLNKDDLEYYILDFSNCVRIFDHNGDFVKFYPFIGEIPGGEEQFVNMVKKGERIEFENYFLFKLNNFIKPIERGGKRNYGIDAEVSDIRIDDRDYNNAEDRPKSLVLGK